MESLRIESKREVCEPLTHARSRADRSCCYLKCLIHPHLNVHISESVLTLLCLASQKKKKKQQKPNVDIKEGTPRPFILGLSESVK